MDFYEECKSDANLHSTSKLEQLLSRLDKKEAQSLREALLDPSIPSRTIERVLRKNKISCGLWSINNWRQENKVPYNVKVMIEGGE
jgi:hypothetical protein